MQITISQLKKAFNDNMAVNIDSLHVNDGEIIGLVGNNGAGKTTMFRLMLDLLKRRQRICGAHFLHQRQRADARNGQRGRYHNRKPSQDGRLEAIHRCLY